MNRVRLGIAVICVFAGCGRAKTGGPDADEVTIVVQGDRHDLEVQEKSLKERESALLSEQNKLEQRRAELEKIRLASDSEQRRRLDDEMAKLRAQQGEVAVKFTSLEAQKSAVQAKKSVLGAPAREGALSDLSAREAGIATREARLAESELEIARREKDVGVREKTLGAREADENGRDRALAAREEQLAQRQRSSGPQGERAGGELREVPRPGILESRHKKLLDELESRGVLIADLPVEEQPLNAEIWSARRQGDYARASDLLADLSQTVKRLKVDQRFVEQKMVRLQALRAAAKLGDSQRVEVERLLREVTSAYSDNRYEVANKGLNRIATILDASPSSG